MGCPSPLGPRHDGVFESYRGPEDDQPKRELIGTILKFTCKNCGQTAEQRATSSGSHHMWRRTDTGEEKSRISRFGPGAMWRVTWYKRDDDSGLYGWDWDNLFEPPLMVTCPNGHDWNIDSRCSNCGSPNDRLHRCWVRHGIPPLITVDKNGVTCNAGAGSIQAGDWHGFLTAGILTETR